MENCNHYMWKTSRKDVSRSIRPFHQHPNTEPQATVFCHFDFECKVKVYPVREAMWGSFTWTQVCHSQLRLQASPPSSLKSKFRLDSDHMPTITFLSRSPQQSTKHFHRFDALHLNQVKCTQKMMDTLGCESFEKLPGLQMPYWWHSYLQPPLFKLPHLQKTASSAQQLCRDRHLSGQGEEVMGKEEEIMTKKPLGVCSDTFNSNLQTSNTTID